MRHTKATIAFGILTIGFATLAIAVQFAHAVNPQPLPPGIREHFIPLHPSGPCSPSLANVCIPSGLTNHFPPPS